MSKTAILTFQVTGALDGYFPGMVNIPACNTVELTLDISDQYDNKVYLKHHLLVLPDATERIVNLFRQYNTKQFAFDQIPATGSAGRYQAISEIDDEEVQNLIGDFFKAIEAAEPQYE